MTGKSSSNLGINLAQHLADTALQRPILSTLGRHGVRIIDPAEFFTGADGIIRSADAGGCLYFDKDHLSTHGSLRLTGVFSTLFGSAQ